jgi:hypothetical protein
MDFIANFAVARGFQAVIQKTSMGGVRSEKCRVRSVGGCGEGCEKESEFQPQMTRMCTDEEEEGFVCRLA